MQNKSRLSKILDSIKSKLILPIAGAVFFSGCYAIIEMPRTQTKVHSYIWLNDYDCDGIPDIYDAYPYFYDYPFLFRPYHDPHFHPMNPWYYTPQIKHDDKKSPPKFEERKKDTKRLRDNSGERNSKGRR